jgi:hypothetical protein
MRTSSGGETTSVAAAQRVQVATTTTEWPESGGVTMTAPGRSAAKITSPRQKKTAVLRIVTARVYSDGRMGGALTR